MHRYWLKLNSRKTMLAAAASARNRLSKPLCQALLQAPPTPTAAAFNQPRDQRLSPQPLPKLFCIDVRSEVFRRARYQRKYRP
jgi:uncharacterized protein YbcC (UPF0753/DUF2309 family)